MPAACRVGDLAFCPADAHGCPGCPHPAVGPAISGSSDVNIEKIPAFRCCDNGIHAACCGPNTYNANKGSATVFINGRRAVRIGDETKHCGGVGQMITGAGTVNIGGAPTPCGAPPPSSNSSSSNSSSSTSNSSLQADFTLSTCRLVKVGGTLDITATPVAGSPGGSFQWTTPSTRVTLVNPTSATVTVRASDTVSSARGAESITVTFTPTTGAPVVKTAEVTVAKVTFSAAPSQRYGYDDFDTPAVLTDDHICVKQSDYTFLHVKIEGGAVGTDFNFAGTDAALITPTTPDGIAEFDLRLDAAAENKKETDLHARCQCPATTSFALIKAHVYKEKVVDIVVAKIDKTTTGTNLRFPTADYSAHSATANAKLKEAVVKYNISNFDSANSVTPVNLAGGAATVAYDIAAGGGADVTAIGSAMTGTGTKIRLAVVRNMISVYKLSAAAAVGATSLTVTASSTFFQVGDTPPLGTGTTRENITISALSGNTITCNALTHAHAAGETIEFPAAGWASDPILIIEGNTALDVIKWTILHEAGHRALTLADIEDPTDFMHFSQGWTDYRLRYCPRRKHYPAGTTATENQWETIPRT